MDKSWIVYLMEKESGWWKQILAGSCFVFLLRLLTGDWVFVAVVILVMVGHELGHQLVYHWRGVRSKVMFLFPLGMVTVPVNEDEEKKSNKLSLWWLGWLMQAGVMVNVVLMLLGWLLTSFGSGQIVVWGENLIVINGSLALTNLIPLGGLDGGNLLVLMQMSLEKETRKQVPVAMMMLAGILVGIVFAPMVGHTGYEITLRVLMSFGWLLVSVGFSCLVCGSKLEKQIKEIQVEGDRMSRGQVRLHFGVYVGMIFTCLSLLARPLF